MQKIKMEEENFSITEFGGTKREVTSYRHTYCWKDMLEIIRIKSTLYIEHSIYQTYRMCKTKII